VRLHNEVPGIVVPEPVQQRLRAAGPGAAEEGLALARELYAEARERAAGVYVIPPFKQPEAALDLFQTDEEAAGAASSIPPDA
jgi:methionine synthase / methylenetetrahydrofolate reductase(NADPH)